MILILDCGIVLRACDYVYILYVHAYGIILPCSHACIFIAGPQTHEIQKVGRRRSSLHTFATESPNLRVEAMSSDPKSKYFLGFRIVNTDDGKVLSQFRAENIVQLRKFMASLGCEIDGLFSESANIAIAVEATHGLWDVVHPSEDELYQRQQIFDAHSKKELSSSNETSDRPIDAPPSYTATVQQLPVGFYFPQDTGVELSADIRAEFAFPGIAMSLYDPNAPPPKAFRRPWHDTFRPPRGPPIISPVSIGYGAEIGLQPGLQALWDPNRKNYFFLDHIQQITFFEDPRPLPEQRPVVTMQSQVYGDRKRESFIPPGVCNDMQVVEATSKRALSRPRGFVAYACGVHGQHGAAGVKGDTGSPGFPGHHGCGSGGNGGSGGPGGAGGPGTNGARGIDGTEASDMILNVTGNSNELHVSGTCNVVANLGGDKAEEIFLVNCRGGNGGHGGRGGDGGTGGIGGHGGSGSTGSHGHSSSSGPGGSGGSGGNGGSGGFGGVGGPGGRGGDGGHAGFGGVCVLQAYDPTLLMLVDADCMYGSSGIGGDKAIGGSGGPGGIGGSGGSGGSGGRGGSYTDSNGHRHSYSSGSSGSGGFRGSNGFPGPNGPDNQPGINGNPANNGAILWVVGNSEGGVLYQAGTRYDAEVTSLKVVSAIDDGIFEPNERILVSEVMVVNSGGLPLPEGASTIMPSTKTIKFEPTRFNLPSEDLFPGQFFVIPITYYGRIFDQPPPNVPGPFISTAEFHPRAELLGRPFEKSFLHQKLVVQYPVKLEYLRCSENLGRGEVSVLEIGVHNISSMPYGSCSGSGGKVVVQLHMDARLIPIGSADIGFTTVPYTITYDPNVRDSMYIQLHEILPYQTVNVQVTVQMESRAELFDRCYWQADLYLRDKLIEYNFEKVRVTPFYIPRDPPADILMITSEAITRKEFVYWQRILEILNVSVDFWDTTRYSGLSMDSQTNTRHQVTWEGRYTKRMILYPHCDINLLLGIDIARHFHGADFQKSTLNELHSSMLLFLPKSEPRGRNADKHSDRGDHQVLRHLSLVGGTVEVPENYGGKHLFSPGTCLVTPKPYLKWEKKYLKKMEKEHPSQSPVVLNRQVNIQSSGTFKYEYGSVDIRHISILRSSNFLVIDGAGGSVVDMSIDDVHLVPSSSRIPLASHYGQVFLATLHCLPMYSKVRLLKNQPEEIPSESTPQVNFVLPNSLFLSLADLVMITASYEIADELYSCSGSAERIQELAHNIEQDSQAFVTNGPAILSGLKLLKKEVKIRKKKVSNAQVSLAISKINTHIRSIERSLSRAGVNTNEERELLIPLDLLMNTEQVHRSHQHKVEDERWNLLEM